MIQGFTIEEFKEMKHELIKQIKNPEPHYSIHSKSVSQKIDFNEKSAEF